MFKPADLVPASAWHLVDILNRAGLPHGVLNLVMGRGRDIGDTLTGDRRVKGGVSFTGSEATGQRVLKSAQAHGARVQLEMGGKNPLVILDDADLSAAVAGAMDGSFGSTGQRCTASSRLIVSNGIHDASWIAWPQPWRTLLWGGTPSTRPRGWGGRWWMSRSWPRTCATSTSRSGGRAPLGMAESWSSAPPRGGHFLTPPALLTDTQATDTVNREEVFGPVASVIRVRDLDHALEVANDTEFGLTSGIYTSSLASSMKFRRESTAGMVMVNLPTAGVDYHVPFGGRGGPRRTARRSRGGPMLGTSTPRPRPPMCTP